MVRGPLPALLILFLASSSALAAQAGPSPEAVNAAIDRGVDYLLRSQNRDGSWGVDLHERVDHMDLRDGPCALAMYTLLKCGVTREHPAIQRGLAFLLESKPHHTYSLGMQLHVLGALQDPAHKRRMEELLKHLLDLHQTGGWDYPPFGRPDLSNTQVASLGVRAAHSAGLEVPRSIWGELVDDALRYQEQPVEIPGAGQQPKEKRRMAGFGYEQGWGASASMTTAGLTILGIASEDPARVDHRYDAKIAEARALALNWLEQHYSVEANPGGEAGWHYYYLYGLERVGAFTGLDRIGDHAWYQDGAAQLLKEQRPDGGWRTDGRAMWPVAPLANPNTCFGLLFLRRATLSGESRVRESLHRAEGPDSAVWVRVDAKPTWTLWITGFAPDERRQAAEGGGVGLRIERVDWWIGGERVESVLGDPTKPWSDERFAIQFHPEVSGQLGVEARVTAREPDGSTRELRSKPLSVRSDYALEPWMLAYARDAEQDVFDGEDIVVTVSSEDPQFDRKADAFDGLQGSSWRAKEDDPEPWLEIEIAKGLRLKELWLSPAAASEVLRAECVLFDTVELRLNGAKTPLVIRIDPDPRLKTKFVLPKPTLVRELELRVPDAPREPGKRVGFAEIEGR
jgi:squalene-hopene/tetraprenyl-beta-curcumene cyclase